MEWNGCLLLANAASTWFMAGVIWFVQLVHYPLFRGIDPAGFEAYHGQHTRRTTWVVLGPMVVEAASAFALLVWRPAGVAAVWPVAGVAMVAALWVSTFAVQVPCHNRLARGFDQGCWQRLCVSNWVRTGLWSARAVLTAGMALAWTSG